MEINAFGERTGLYNFDPRDQIIPTGVNHNAKI